MNLLSVCLLERQRGQEEEGLSGSVCYSNTKRKILSILNIKKTIMKINMAVHVDILAAGYKVNQFMGGSGKKTKFVFLSLCV